MDEYSQRKYWTDFKKQDFPDGHQNLKYIILANAKIHSYLYAPLIAPFSTLKEDDAKVIVSQYHNEKLWIPEPVDITIDLIAHITGLPTIVDPIPVSSKNLLLLKEPTGSWANKNSKGIMINHIANMEMKYKVAIVSIFLTNSSWPSDVKQEMLEEIKNITFKGKFYNQAMHITELTKVNCEGCQELDSSIRFPSLLIWNSMMHITPVGEPYFNSFATPTMKHFQCLIPKGKFKGLASAYNMFDSWLQAMNSSCH